MIIPVIGFAGWSGSGKTTVIEKLIPLLAARNLRTAVIKHDGHGFEIDQPGKDTWRHMQAGAEEVIITSPGRTARISRHGASLPECIRMVKDADVILVEGFKHEEMPRIGICRTADGIPLPDDASTYIAVVSDSELPGVTVPQFAFTDTERLADFIAGKIRNMNTQDFTHFDDQGRSRMVDVGEKDVTRRTALAAGRVLVNEETFRLIRTGGMKKGDVLAVAQVAGIMGAKHTPDLIPMCHPIFLNGIDLKLWLDETRLSVEIEAGVSCEGKTGAEMEALTAVSTAALTVYDMCKAVQKDIVISDIRLLRKTGGVHGDYERNNSNE